MSNLDDWQTTSSMMPAYLSATLIITGSIYGGLRFLGRHASSDKRDTLALWLMGANEDRWPRQFCEYFDRFFGERHLSWHCFYRSALISIIGVLLFYILFGPVLGILLTRALHVSTPRGGEPVTLTVAAEGALEVWHVLAFALMVNVVADYISLLQTRWVLQRMSREQHVIFYFLWLALDFIVSALIIWIAIGAYSFIRGEPPPSLIELTALFSIYSMFFYSSFVTSVWAIFFALATALLRLFTRAGLNRVLDVEHEPANQVALTISSLVAIVMITGGGLGVPRTLGDEQAMVSLDLWLCSRFRERACPVVVSQERRRAERVCGLGDEGACIRFIAFRELACKTGSAGACISLHELSQPSGPLGHLHTQSAGYAERACALGDPVGCSAFGLHLSRRGLGERDEAEAVEVLEYACQGGRGLACQQLGETLLYKQRVERYDVGAAAAFRRGCHYGTVSSCVSLGLMYKQAPSEISDDRRAVVLFRRACHQGDRTGCYNLGLMLYEGRGITRDITAAMTKFREACDVKHEPACQALDRARTLKLTNPNTRAH